MKTPLIVSRTFEVITPESAENGALADHGFIYEKKPMTFREALEEIRSLGSLDHWDDFSFYPADGSIDYRTGEHEREAVHIDPVSPAAIKAWFKVLDLVGLA